MRDIARALGAKEVTLTPFEEADYNLLMFAEHAVFHSQLRRLLDRIKIVDTQLECSKEIDPRLIAEKELLNMTLITFLDSYDMFVYEA